MKWTVLTCFPEMFNSFLSTSLFGKAVKQKILSVELIDFRKYSTDKHRVIDEPPFGGGAGMVIKIEPVVLALEDIRQNDPKVRVILLSPQGGLLQQNQVKTLAGFEHLALVCGRYEGIDDRVRHFVDEEISIGDYVLAGGEAAAWVVMEAVSRLVPGVVGKEESLENESFVPEALLEYPHYTRPRVFRNLEVPEILVSGNHAAIQRWRRQQSLLRTAKQRPDLLTKVSLSPEDKGWLESQNIH